MSTAGTPLTPSFVMDLETRMQILAETEYQRLSDNVVWPLVAKVMQSASARERLIWLLDTAQIQESDRQGGEVEFDDLITQTTEFEHKAATAGLELNRFKLEDLDGGGVQIASEWARQIGAQAAYWPQKQVMQAIRDGGLAGSTTYDGKPFFATDHPLNPFRSSVGVYSNLISGKPIDNSVTVQKAFENLSDVITQIRKIKMPNGEDPRMLKPMALMHPPALTTRVNKVLQARFIAEDAESGSAASADVEAAVKGLGIQRTIEADELGAGFTNGSDTTYYIVAEALGSSQLGALTYLEREPFSIVFNGQMTSAELNRANKLQWVTRGRNVVGYGHPYLLFRVTQ